MEKLFVSFLIIFIKRLNTAIFPLNFGYNQYIFFIGCDAEISKLIEGLIYSIIQHEIKHTRITLNITRLQTRHWQGFAAL